MKQATITALSRFGMVVVAFAIMGTLMGPLYASSVEKIKTKEMNEIEQQEVTEVEEIKEEIEEPVVELEEVPPIVYQDMTMEKLAEKLNRSLTSTVSNQGYLFASYSLEKGVDPYLAVAIMLQETGCKWKCSTLVTKCNNVGGIRGNASCGSSGYMKFPSLEVGIKSYIDNLARNYIAHGLTTPSAISTKYVGYENPEWVAMVNSYINEIETK